MIKKSHLKRLVALFLTVAFLVLDNQISQASLGGVEDYSNPRIVPMYNDKNTDWAAYSAFLYSPRILFTVAHGEYYFDENGNKINRSPWETYAGLPNSIARYGAPRVRVIKRIISKTYRFDSATLGDFAVFVLEKDLADVKPALLLTPQIKDELVAQHAEVRLHGYGAYQDFCQPGQSLPCISEVKKRSTYPRLLTAKLYTWQEAGNIVGYQRPQLKTSLTYFRAGKESLCSGDSGGSNTVLYKGQLLYLSVTGNGMNAYACGASSYYDGVGGILYSTPVYDHLDIIKEAEEFVTEQLKLEAAANPKPTDTPSAIPSAMPSAMPSAAPSNSVLQTLVNKVATKTTITCIKGKSIKKVTAQNPKCPVGYKRKI